MKDIKNASAVWQMRFYFVLIADQARSTALLFKHCVQTCSLLGTPFTLHFTRFTFAWNILLDLL